MTEKNNRVNRVSVERGKKISDLMEEFTGTGFNAKRLGRACKIYEDMIRDEHCLKIMTLAGAMVPAGMGRVISGYIKEGFVDILVTTGATLTHDLIESLGCAHLQGTEHASDEELRARQTNRIFDVFMPNSAYEQMEDFVKALDFDKTMPLVDFLDFLGRKMGETLSEANLDDSIIRNCHLNHVSIYCPAFTDCGLGIQLLLNHPGLKLDIFEDLNRIINKAWESESVGVFIIGGGVPKNYTFQALQFSPNSATYAIQITTDRPEPGGLSGATLDEAVSWGKVNATAPSVTVICDATIALPLILSYLKDTFAT